MHMDLFKKRMQLAGSCLGEKQITTSNYAEMATFRNDVNYRRGMLYDWDMNPLEEVEFKFEKVSTFSFEKRAIEYLIRFRPEYQPEYKFAMNHFRKDGKERLGFYIDVYDHAKKIYEKWMIVGKDSRTLFDRYNALKCNWFFEWIEKGQYKRCLGIVRDAADNAFYSANVDPIGGTRISGTTSFILPYNRDTAKIAIGKSFIFSDNIEFPQSFRVNQIKDNTVPGVIRFYTKEELFNEHKDYVGEVNGRNIPFTFETPIPDLPDGWGGKIHMLCDAVYETPDKNVESETSEIILKTEAHNAIFVNGAPVTVDSSAPVHEWILKVDDQFYYAGQLTPYFEITQDEKSLVIKAISKELAKYVLTISAKDAAGKASNEIRLVVKV